MQVFMRAYSSALAEPSLAEARNLTQLTLLKVVNETISIFCVLCLPGELVPPNALLTTLLPPSHDQSFNYLSSHARKA